MEKDKKEHPELQKALARKPWKLLFIGAASLVVLAFGATAGYAFYLQDRVLPHTTVAGVSVGGLKKADATAAVQAKVAAFSSSSLTLSYQGKTWSVPAKNLGLQFDVASAVNDAYSQGKSGGALDQVKDFFSSLVSSRSYQPDLAPIGASGRAALESQVLGSIEKAPAETTLSLVPGKVEVKAGAPGKKLDYNSFEAVLASALGKDTKSIALNLAVFQPEVTEAMAEPARQQAEALLSSPWKAVAGSVSADYSPADVAAWLTVSVARDSTGTATGLSIGLNDDAIKSKTAAFAASAAVKPVNAQLQPDATGLAVVQPDKPGQEVKADDIVTAVKTALLAAAVSADHTVTVPVTTVQADLRADSLASIGVKELIGTATTDFSGSPTNRVFNITKGAHDLNGSYIKPGDTFSTIGALGPIETSTGYREELVIKGNRTVPDAGGGLCQVSTTLFRAVLNAGLPVTERVNHSYRVSYYEVGVGPGLDATIYDPSPDLKWKNDTGNGVYVQTIVQGTKITFNLYGTKDGRTATVGTPKILETIPVGPPVYANSDTLYVGQTQQVEHPHDGAKTTVDYTVHKADGTTVTQTFNSYYEPWPAQFLVGTKPRP